MFRFAVDWGVQPSEFWAMTMNEWYAIMLSHIDPEKAQKQDKIEEIVADNKLSDEEWWAKHGG